MRIRGKFYPFVHHVILTCLDELAKMFAPDEVVDRTGQIFQIVHEFGAVKRAVASKKNGSRKGWLEVGKDLIEQLDRSIRRIGVAVTQRGSDKQFGVVLVDEQRMEACGLVVRDIGYSFLLPGCFDTSRVGIEDQVVVYAIQMIHGRFLKELMKRVVQRGQSVLKKAGNRRLGSGIKIEQRIPIQDGLVGLIEIAKEDLENKLSQNIMASVDRIFALILKRKKGKRIEQTRSAQERREKDGTGIRSDVASGKNYSCQMKRFWIT